MATRIPAASRNAHADLEAARTDAGSGPGYIEVYTGSQPATADTAATGTLLVTVTLNDPAYGSSSSGVATLDVTPEPSATAVAAGTPGWYRVKDSTGATVRDGSISGMPAVSVGDTVLVTGGTLTMPATT